VTLQVSAKDEFAILMGYRRPYSAMVVVRETLRELLPAAGTLEDE
jgi:hypothetical protein